MPDQFSRTRLLLGAEAVRTLQQARVIVFGVGGVGGFAVEALARVGVGTIDLVDNDTVRVLHHSLGGNTKWMSSQKERKFRTN